MRKILLLVVVLISASAWANPAEQAFQQILALKGTWEGTFQGQPIQLIYEPISEQSAVMERMVWVADGSSMTTVYHPDGEKLMATHYCKAKNQPRLVSTPSEDSSSLKFEFLDGAKPSETYVSGIKLKFISENQLEQTVHFKGKTSQVTVLYTRKR